MGWGKTDRQACHAGRERGCAEEDGEVGVGADLKVLGEGGGEEELSEPKG